MNFAGFKNVNIQLIEDGATNARWFKSGTDTMLKTKAWSNANTNFPWASFATAPNIKGVVRSWWSDNQILDLNKYADKTYNSKPYNFFEYKDLSDAIFNTRDINNSRLMGTWPKVSGLNWEDAADKVAAAHKANGRKSLIVLGTYKLSGEEEWIKQVWKDYHNEYNIFYKGHPGHMEHPLFVENWIKEENPEGMYNLEPMISSEELTAQHVIPKTGAVAGEKYIQFDKVAVAGSSSAVTSAAFPNLDLTKDLIEVYGGSGARYINPSVDPTSTNWDKAISLFINVIGPNPTN